MIMKTSRPILFRIKTVAIPALIAIFLFAFLAFGCTKSEDLAPAHYDKGVELYQDEDYRGAVIEFKNALQLDPRLSIAHYKLGLSYLELKDAVNAYRQLEMAAQVDPSNVDAITKAAEMLFLGNEIHESRKRLKKALKVDPNHVDALLLATSMELKAKHINEAEMYIDKAYKLDPDSDRIFLARANIHLAKKNYGMVQESIEKALEINPENEAAYKALMIYMVATNNLDEAEKTLQKMFDFFPDSPMPYLEMAKIKELNNDVAGAATSLRKAIEKDPQDPELHVISAQFYEKYNQLQKAESSYKEAVSVAKRPIDYQAILADFYYNQKKYDLAREQVKIILAKYPEHMNGIFIKAKLLLENDDKTNDAIPLLEKLSVKNRQWSEVFFYRARAHFKLHEIDKALKVIEIAVAQSPDNPEYRLLLAHLLYSKGEFYQARDEARFAVSMKPNSYAAAILYGKTLYMTESYNQAIEFFKKLDTAKPNDYEILYNLGLSQMAVEDYRSAPKTLLKAVSLKSGYTPALEALLNILLVNNQAIQAISFLESQIKANPLSPNLLMLYGTLLYNDGRLKDALTAFRQVQEIAPDFPSAYMMEALVLKKSGKLDEEVAKKYRDLAHDKTVTSESQMVLARILEMSGDIEGAKDAYRRVLGLSPEFSTAANNLAWLMANDGNPNNLDEAMNWAQVAKDEQPTNTNFLDTVGWVNYKQGQYYNAALKFKQAIDKSPGKPVLHYHLALALAGQNKKEDAVHAVKQSLKLSDSFPDRDKAEALYKKLTGRDFK